MHVPLTLNDGHNQTTVMADGMMYIISAYKSLFQLLKVVHQASIIYTSLACEAMTHCRPRLLHVVVQH